MREAPRRCIAPFCTTKPHQQPLLGLSSGLIPQPECTFALSCLVALCCVNCTRHSPCVTALSDLQTALRHAWLAYAPLCLGLHHQPPHATTILSPAMALVLLRTNTTTAARRCIIARRVIPYLCPHPPGPAFSALGSISLVEGKNR